MNTITEGNWIETKWGGAVVLAIIVCANGTAYEVLLWKNARIVCIDDEDIVELEMGE